MRAMRTMLSMSPNCPVCSSPDVKRHCTSPMCDLVLCGQCRGYGTEDGTLWQRKVR